MITDPREIYRQLAELAAVNPEQAAQLHQRYEAWTTDPDPVRTEIDIMLALDDAFNALDNEIWWRRR